ncbi:hypothetical protein [Serratia ureilytica]|uniref:hypothetical protein n=1 Tax=Serratia ureilytica TaxID=300181 RepID=UPI0018D6100F|nr:hypothetical protein [Serratia ureilytica]MBH3008765.1 hypothetical protein [Serratia ureilytica]
MSYGINLLNESGDVWLSPEYTPINLIDKSVIKTVRGNEYVSSIPNNKAHLFFISLSSNVVVVFEESLKNGVWCLSIKSSSGISECTIYAFSNMAKRNANYGLCFFSEDGEVTYSADMLPLEINKESIPITGMVSKDIGEPVAVMPCISGMISDFNTEIGGYNIYLHTIGAYGNILTNNRVQVAGGASGPISNHYQNDFFYIKTTIYNT